MSTSNTNGDVVTCIRCHVATIAVEDWPGYQQDGEEDMISWEGSSRQDPVCPGCQHAEWHPHCMALLDQETGEVLNPEVEWAGCRERSGTTAVFSSASTST